MGTPTRTEDGLKLIVWSLLLYFVVTLLSVSGALLLVVLRPTDISTFVTLGAAFGLPAALLTLVLVILFLVGYFTLYPHRREFGPVHEKSVGRSLFLFIGSVVAFLVVQVVFFLMFFLTFAGIFLPFDPTTPPTAPTPEQMRQALLPALVVGQGLDIFVALLLALFLYFIVVALLPPGQSFRLKLATALFVLGPAAGFVIFSILFLTGQLFVPAFQDGTNPFMFPAFGFQFQDVLAGLVRSSLQAVAALFFWMAYRSSLEAMRGGTVQPTSSTA